MKITYNSKIAKKKKRNQGKAKCEKKPFFWSIAGWSNRAITIFTVMSPSPKLLLWCFVASSTLWRAASTLSDGKPSLQTMHRYVSAHIMYFWLSLVGPDGKMFGPQSWWKFCTAKIGLVDISKWSQNKMVKKKFKSLGKSLGLLVLGLRV